MRADRAAARRSRRRRRRRCSTLVGVLTGCGASARPAGHLHRRHHRHRRDPRPYDPARVGRRVALARAGSNWWTGGRQGPGDGAARRRAATLRRRGSIPPCARMATWRPGSRRCGRRGGRRTRPGRRRPGARARPRHGRRRPRAHCARAGYAACARRLHRADRGLADPVTTCPASLSFQGTLCVPRDTARSPGVT